MRSLAYVGIIALVAVLTGSVGLASEAESLYEQAAALEREGRGPDAVRIYERAARGGHGKSALRLGEIYDKGIPGVERDYATSLKWYHAALVLGEQVPMAKSRGEPASATTEAARRAEAEAAKRAAEEAKRAEESKRDGRFYKEPYGIQPPAGKESPPPDLSGSRQFAEAEALERAGKGAEAVKMYVRAARTGHGKAALRLAQIYESGIPGVAQNREESRKWYNAARVLGEDVPIMR